MARLERGYAPAARSTIIVEEVVRCRVRRAPSNSPRDPSYVGSPYGLARPSYYGMPPAPGFDPLERPLPVCP